MKLQEMVNKLSNMLASGMGEAEIKFGEKDVEQIDLVEKDGVKMIVLSEDKQ